MITAATRSHDTAVSGSTLMISTSIGVIRAPPPTPVIPTRNPTIRPQSAMGRSIIGVFLRSVVARLQDGQVPGCREKTQTTKQNHQPKTNTRDAREGFPARVLQLREVDHRA